MTDWVDGNTAANPTADDMDGGGTDLASGDTINITKNLVIDKSVGCGTITSVVDLTVNNTFTLTMDASATVAASGDVDVTGTLDCSAAGAVSFGSLTINSGGTYAATSGTTTITSENGSGNAFNNASGGTFTHNNGTLTFTTPAGTNFRLNGTGNPYNVIVNHASAVIVVAATSTFENDLTITLGQLYCGAALTVTGDVSVTGTLDGVASAMSFGSLTINSGGTYSATSGTTTITSETSGGRAVDLASSGTLTHNSGTFSITTATGTVIVMSGTGNFYNLSVDLGSVTRSLLQGTAMTIDNNFTIDDTLWNTQSAALTVTGTTTIGDGVGAASSAQLVCNSSTVDLNGNLTIDTDGALSMPDGSGAFTLAGNLTNSGTITDNDGTITFDKAGAATVNIGSDDVYNIIANHASLVLTLASDLPIKKTLTVTAGIIKVPATFTLSYQDLDGTSNGTIQVIPGGIVYSRTGEGLDTGPPPPVPIPIKLPATQGGSVHWQGVRS